MAESELTTVEELFKTISQMSREEQSSLLMYVRGILDSRKIVHNNNQ